MTIYSLSCLISILIFLSNFPIFEAFSSKDSREFLIKLVKTLLTCSSSALTKTSFFGNCFLKLTSVLVKVFKSNDLEIIFFNSSFFITGKGILAKSENSLTSFSISLICLFMVFK